MIQFKSVHKSYDSGKTLVLDGIDLVVPPGQTMVLLGASGCGKTTTLKLINRLTDPTSGLIHINETDIRSVDLLVLRRSIGYVFQGIGLFPHMTIENNIGIVPRLLGWPRKRRISRAYELLELVGLEPKAFARRQPRSLSGGQRQRVGVARALAADPPILLMDEPFGALDPLSREALQLQVLRLKRELKKTIVFVTHDLFEAMLLADQIAVMNEGRIEQVGPPSDLVNRPATEYVASLFERATSSCRLLSGHEE